MRSPSRILLTLLGLFLSAGVLADADKDSLLEAWEEHVRILPGTISLEATGDGTYRLQDEDLLAELSGAMASASICGLGQAAGNPINSVLEYFPEDL